MSCWVGLAYLGKPCSADWKLGSQQEGTVQKPHLFGGNLGTNTPKSQKILSFINGVFEASLLKINGNLLLLLIFKDGFFG